LRRIAQAGLTGLAGVINGTAAPEAPAAPPPGLRGPAVAEIAPRDPADAFASGALGYSAR